MPLEVISVDEHTPAGAFLDAFFRHGVDSRIDPLGVIHRRNVRRLYSLLTADPATVQGLLSRDANGLIYCSFDDPIPLAMRPLLLEALQTIHDWAWGTESAWASKRLVVFDNQAVELMAQHNGRSYRTACVTKRRLPATNGTELCLPTVVFPDQHPSPLQPIYKLLLQQFFCAATSLVVRPMDEPRPTSASGRGRAIQTTNDVNRVIVRRGVSNGAGHPTESIEHVVFAKFGAPYRLEREFANFNRLTTAVARELCERPEDRVHMRRLFGYGHLSDTFRPIAESASDFLGLFVASWHSHTSPPSGREKRDGRLDHLLARDCIDFESPDLVPVFEQICATLAVLQGPRWTAVRQADGRRYHSFFHPKHVLSLNFHDVRSHRPGQRKPKGRVVCQIHRAELLASRRQQPVDRLDCRVSELSDQDLTIPEGRTPLALAGLTDPDVGYRLIVKADAVDAVGEAVGVIARAYETPIRESAFISFPERLRKDPRRFKSGYLDQIRSLVNAQVGAFTHVATPERNQLINDYSDIYGRVEVTSREPQLCLLAPRVHGDLYLVNVLWSREPGARHLDFSIIDFEKMEYDAPAAWDYVILELSLRFHWFLETFKGVLLNGSAGACEQTNHDWHGGIDFDGVDKRVHRLEAVLVSLAPDASLDADFAAIAPGVTLLRRLVKTVRAGFLSRSRAVETDDQGADFSDDDARIDYNRAMLMAAASRAVGRHPGDHPTGDGALRILWLRHIARNALSLPQSRYVHGAHYQPYRLSPEGP